MQPDTGSAELCFFFGESELPRFAPSSITECDLASLSTLSLSGPPLLLGNSSNSSCEILRFLKKIVSFSSAAVGKKWGMKQPQPKEDDSIPELDHTAVVSAQGSWRLWASGTEKAREPTVARQSRY